MGGFNFDAEARAQILAAIKERRPVIRCYVCETEKWTLAEGWISLPLLSNFYMNQRGKGSLVGVALICDRCGNTLLMNLGQLGLSHLIAPDPNEMRKRLGLPPKG